MAHKKAGGSSRNGRDSNAKRLGVKAYGGEVVLHGSIWDEANEKLCSMPVHRILESNRVAVVCTTDDPTDSLEHHRKIRDDGRLKTRVYPAWRPDKALAVDQPAARPPGDGP